MVTPELSAYIRQQLGTGIAEDIIKSRLSALGWSEQDVSDAFSGMGSVQPQHPATPQPFISPLPVLRMPEQVQVPVQTPVQIPPTQAPIQIPVQPRAQGAVPSAGPKSHKGMWIAISAAIIVLAAAGGAFVAYQAGLFALLMPPPAPVIPPAPHPLAGAMSTTSAPSVPAASSTVQVSLSTGSSTAASLSANPTAPLPTATLTVNNATSTVASASAFTLKWSSTNATTFSATRSVSGCLIPVMDTPDTVMSSISSARGTNTSFMFTKNDLALLAGCSVTVTYTATDAKSAQQAQATVTITFPSNASTTAQLIKMTSL